MSVADRRLKTRRDSFQDVTPRIRWKHELAFAAYGTILLGLGAAVAVAQPTGEQMLDPIQRAVVESLDSSLALPGGGTPPALLEAAIRAADVEAFAAAAGYLGQLAVLADKAGEDGPALFANLADAVDNVALTRLASAMDNREPAASRLVRAILRVGRMRRRDPDWLAQSAAALASADLSVRQAAAEQLARAGVDALPVIVPFLGAADKGTDHAGRLARELIARLGSDARQPLLDWLATGDPADWAAVIEAIDVSGASEIETFLLAPALVPDTPPAARAAARQVLEWRAARRGADQTSVLPASDAAIARLAARLDRLLSPAGLPAVDCLALEPIVDPAAIATALGGNVDGTVSRWFWNPQARVFDRVDVPPRVARAREAMHLARDLQVLDAYDEQVIDLVLLAQLETALVTSGKTLPELEQMPAEVVRQTLAGPEGFTVETAGRVFEQAILRDMWPAAAATARGIGPDSAAATGPAGSEGTLPPNVRDVLVRGIAVPDAAVQFAAARALALTAGDPPYRGSSRVREVLLHAATSTGTDRVVIAHPVAAVAHELAAGVSHFGYEPVVVSTGRHAVFAARESADTVLVLLGSRITRPTALETTQFLQQQPLDDIPPVLVIIDPLDDDGRGKYLTRLLLSFRQLEQVGITDRLDSLLWPAPGNSAEQPARFPDVLAQTAGPAAVDPASRNAAAAARLGRASESLAILADLARRGWDVAPAEETAQRALLRAELHAPAISLLAGLGSPQAQLALEQEALRHDLPAADANTARAAFAASVERFGILMKSGQILNAYARYNPAADDTSRGVAGGILDVLEAAGSHVQTPSSDAPPVPSRQ